MGMIKSDWESNIMKNTFRHAVNSLHLDRQTYTTSESSAVLGGGEGGVLQLVDVRPDILGGSLENFQCIYNFI